MPPRYPDIPESEYKNRISRAQRLMKQQDLDAILISSAVNTYYFTGYDSLMLYPPEADQPRAVIILRDREPVVAMGGTNAVESMGYTSWARDVRQIPRPYESETRKLVARIWKELKLKGGKVGAEIGHSGDKVELPGVIFMDLLKESRFVDITSLMYDLRIVKSDEEIRRIREAAKISDRAFQRLVSYIKIGATEREISQRLAAFMCEEGADRIYYTLVRSAERYYKRLHMVLPYDRKIKGGDYVKIEYSADYRHYLNEAKSLVIVGARPKAAERDHYLAFVEAVKQGAKAAKPGATAADVGRAEMKALKESGVKVPPDRIGGGHGTGLDGHEPPKLDARDKTRLRAGMVVVVEPGGIPNAEGSYGYISAANTVIVSSAGGDRLPPLSEDILVV